MGSACSRLIERICGLLGFKRSERQTEVPEEHNHSYSNLRDKMVGKRKTKKQQTSQKGRQTCSSTRDFQGYNNSNCDNIEGTIVDGETISQNQRATTSQRVRSSTKADLQGHNNSHYTLKGRAPISKNQQKIQSEAIASRTRSQTKRNREENNYFQESTQSRLNYRKSNEEEKKSSQNETSQTNHSATKETLIDNNSRTTKKLKVNSTEVVTENNYLENHKSVSDLLDDIPHTSQSDLNPHRLHLEKPQSNKIGHEQASTGNFRKPEALEEHNNTESSLNYLKESILNYEEQKASDSSSYPLEKNDHGDWNNDIVLDSHMQEKDLDEEKKIIEALNKIHSQALPFTEKIENFTELEDSNQHYYIDESLSRLVKKLDYMDDDVGENERLIEKRKEVYKFIFSLVRALDKKVEQNRTQQNISHTEYN